MSLDLNKDGNEKIEEMLYRKGLILESMIKKRAPVYTGQYRSLWSTEKMGDGSVQVVNPQGGKGRALEFGGEPGQFPPLDELRTWVRRKIDPEDVDTTTYLIGRSIEKNGVEPNPHVRPAIRGFKNREL